jgi:hypothetical protein
VIARICTLLVMAGVLSAAAAAYTVRLEVHEAEPAEPVAAPKRRPDQLPGSRVARGDGNIAVAWLAGPTRRYDHGVLGDGVEASRLAVETRDGKTIIHALPASRVFEDLMPRLVDLDQDGVDEILVVETDSALGASLAVYAVAGDRIVRQAMTPFLGQSYRWLNPLGVGDFDGDGRLDIALVATPHIGGRLRLYQYTAPTLTRFAETGDVSTHAIGSRELGLGRIVPYSDRDRFLLPDQSHRSLLLLEWTPDGIRELARVALPSAIQTSLELSGNDRWRFRTRDGRFLEVRLH